MYSCCVLCLMLCYPILSQPYPIQCYPTPSYPITLDDIISHPGSFLSDVILSNLIVFYPNPNYIVSSHSILSGNILPVFCIAAHSIILFLFAVTYPHSATWSNLPISLLSPFIFILCCWMKLYTAPCYLLDKHAYPVVWPLQL